MPQSAQKGEFATLRDFGHSPAQHEEFYTYITLVRLIRGILTD